MSKKTKKKPASKSRQTAEWHNNVAVDAAKRRDFSTAKRNLLLAVALDLQHKIAWRNLGLVYTKTINYPKAQECFERAIKIDQKYALAWCGLGCVKQYQGDYAGASEAYDRALLMSPVCANSHTSRAYLRLLQGDLARGFAEYSWRWKADDHARLPAFPRWQGEDLAGKTILVHTEQGFGDTIMFFRYLGLVRKRNPRSIIFVCEPELLSIFRRSQSDWADAWFAGGVNIPEITEGSWDYATSVGDLPEIMGHECDNRPYLFSKKPLSGDLSSRCLRIGFKWQGRPTHDRDLERSIPLEMFRPLMAIPGVQLVSLQTKDFDCPLRSFLNFPEWNTVENAGGKFDLNSFEDAADCIAGLDLLVTVDTSLAHLAGAMGAPVWNFISFSPDWRWQLSSPSTHWYPSMRLWRQPKLGDWESFLARVRDGIVALLRPQGVVL